METPETKEVSGKVSKLPTEMEYVIALGKNAKGHWQFLGIAPKESKSTLVNNFKHVWTDMKDSRLVNVNLPL